MVFLVFRHTCISAPKTFAYYAFLARFDGISVERFGQAVARILARLRLAKIPIQLGIYCTQIRPNNHDILAISGQ